MKLTGRHKSELISLSRKSGLWFGVEPHQADPDLSFYLSNGLARHIGQGKGYEITPAGRAALKEAQE